ncbi:hypothetical protein OUN72_002845 [Salmonella enterica subsp. enterica serovar Essen]|nr:hypothetical protein [Salmonella enterica]EHM3442383.1 hypothetical protein [Salmonella enterica subsp. enterica]MJP99751.1 hypothetical protein [Salmonella enterica subsp. enterica serovar Othmarschen]EHW9182599.1 hypothetical protein [Salmonella enterica subsp. enterica]EIX6435085.1 hypothetical protein [Salmonella enterica]
MNAKNFWFTVQDCENLANFPKGAQNIRNKLEKLLEGRSELKRKRKGSKGYEYHSSILPEQLQNCFEVEDSAAPQKRTTEATTDSLDIWIMIFRRLSAVQQQAAIDTFFSGGIKELMPAVADIGNPARKEILGQYSEPGRVETAGDSVGPQDMKKAG